MQRHHQPETRLIRQGTDEDRRAADLRQLLFPPFQHFYRCSAGLGYPLARQEFEDAVTVLKKLGLIRKAVERNRRPTLEELDALMEHFCRIRENRPSSLPMQKIIAFAIFSTRRQEEITLLRWDDLDGDRIVVRDMKHPGDKKGNNVYCELAPEALAIINSMPREGEQIFPDSSEAISAAFTRACKVLGIEEFAVSRSST